MLAHFFIGTRLGWGEEKDVIWFDADLYTEEEAFAQFKPIKGETLKANGYYYDYTAYEYDGIKYHDLSYHGVHDFDNRPFYLL